MTVTIRIFPLERTVISKLVESLPQAPRCALLRINHTDADDARACTRARYLPSHIHAARGRHRIYHLVSPRTCSSSLGRTHESDRLSPPENHDKHGMNEGSRGFSLPSPPTPALSPGGPSAPGPSTLSLPRSRDQQRTNLVLLSRTTTHTTPSSTRSHSASPRRPSLRLLLSRLSVVLR